MTSLTKGPGFETRLDQLVFALGKEYNRHCSVAQFAGNIHWAEPSPLFAHRARPSPLNCKNEYPVLPRGEETAAQTVVGSIGRAFRRLKNPRFREMSVRGYALYSVCPQLFFYISLPLDDENCECTKAQGQRFVLATEASDERFAMSDELSFH